jgi:imidazolonepropionase-like amidohydrolase
MRRSVVILAFSVVACTPPADLAIHDVTVIDAVNGVRTGQTVVVDGGRIVRVGPTADAVKALETIDGEGRFLIPGLWDFHVHLTYDEAFTEAMPGLFLSYGITSIRDTGGVLEKVLPVVQTLRAEGATAPRVFFSGPLLDGEHVVYDGQDRPALAIGNPDVETARRNVAMLADAGVDFLKIYEMVTPEVFAALVEEANARGLPMDGHVPLSMLARDAGPHVQSLEHLRNLEMDCAAGAESLLEERRRILDGWEEGPGGDLRSRLHSLQRLPAVADYDEARCSELFGSLMSTIQVPTLRLNGSSMVSPFDRPDWTDALDRLPDDVATAWREATERRRGTVPSADTTYAAWSLFLVGLMHDAGVPIGAGTDTPIGFSVPGYSLHSELEMLVRAGLSPLEALHAATVRPAEFFGLTRAMGTVEEGRLADLVLLGANPLEDIANTRAVEAVVTKGVLLDRAELDALVH